MQSFFGMNITGKPEVTEFWTNRTVITVRNSSSSEARTPERETSSTYISTTTDAVENKTWKISLFWQIAIPLAFASIVIPLVGGTLYRNFMQQALLFRVIVNIVFILGVLAAYL